MILSHIQQFISSKNMWLGSETSIQKHDETLFYACQELKLKLKDTMNMWVVCDKP